MVRSNYKAANVIAVRIRIATKAPIATMRLIARLHDEKEVVSTDQIKVPYLDVGSGIVAHSRCRP